jgi:hypothetical protein
MRARGLDRRARNNDATERAANQPPAVEQMNEEERQKVEIAGR